MDIFVLKALSEALRQRLCGAVVSKVFQMGPDDLILRLWRQRDYRVLLSTAPQWPRLHLTATRFRNPPQPPRFAAFLRAHLTHVRLSDLVVRPYDRVVSFYWAPPGETTPTLQLIHTLQGAQANVVLVNAEDVILDALKYVPSETASRRPILPGQPYTPLAPPAQRCLLSEVTVERLQDLHAQGALHAQGLQRLLVGFSPLLAAEVCHRSHGEPQRCWAILQELRQHYDAGTLSLFLCTMPDGAQHLSALPLAHCAATITPYAQAEEAVMAWCEPYLETETRNHLRRTVHKTVQQRLHKLQHKMANLTQDAQTLERYIPYQRYGTLLVTQRVPRGATSVTVVDYYSPEQALLTIPLDPRCSLQDNAQVYFKKYRKAQYGLTKVQTLLTQCAAEVQYLEGIACQILQADDNETLETIASELGTAVSQPGLPRRPASSIPTALPYRTFVLSDGTTAYCGKHNQGNDLLLRQVAAPEDVWLHAHQHAGAHVVLKVPTGQEVVQATLLQAAALAAFYSKGKSAPVVEVMYTRAKDVRKFRGARPGQVRVTAYRTVAVAPQPPDMAENQGILHPQTRG
jgi:predicted ribosome quality control (RQC) complex YloA/Tae2 family protein